MQTNATSLEFYFIFYPPKKENGSKNFYKYYHCEGIYCNFCQ